MHHGHSEGVAKRPKIWGEFINFAEVWGYAICIIGLGVDAPAAMKHLSEEDVVKDCMLKSSEIVLPDEIIFFLPHIYRA